MFDSHFTVLLPMAYFVLQSSALRSMPGRWFGASAVPVGVMGLGLAAYCLGVVFGMADPAVFITLSLPLATAYLVLLWASYLFLRPDPELEA